MNHQGHAGWDGGNIVSVSSNGSNVVNQNVLENGVATGAGFSIL